MTMRGKGQVEVAALAGAALAALFLMALILFVKPPTLSSPPLVKMKPIKNAVCPIEPAKFQLTISNPKNNPEIFVKLNSKIFPEGMSWFDLPNAKGVAGGVVYVPPGGSVTVYVYGMGAKTGEHTVYVTISYGVRGYNKVLGTVTVKVPFLVMLCG